MLKRILPSLIPWIGLGLAFQWLQPRWIPLVWLVLLAYFIAFGWRFLRVWHPLSWTNLVLFIVLFLNGYFGASSWLSHHGGLTCYAVLAIVGAITILVGAPFSATYARTLVPQEKWNHPLFKRINLVVSSAWAFVFAINAAVCALVVEPPFAARMICLSLVVLAVIFSDRYPKHVRNNTRAESTKS